MGIYLLASCYCCQKKTSVVFGSSLAEHGKVFWFPHHCSCCNQIISVDIYKQNTKCPNCNKDEFFSYAAPTKTLITNSFLNKFSDNFIKLLGFHKNKNVKYEMYAFRLQRKFSLLNIQHYCPSCKSNSVFFHFDFSFD
jgi:predicted Zn-ribbon and HTH transcriptional regulator